MGLLREILNREKASYNISKSRFLKFSKKMHFCPKNFANIDASADISKFAIFCLTLLCQNCGNFEIIAS